VTLVRAGFVRVRGLAGVAGVLVDEELLGRAEVGRHPNSLAYDRRRRRRGNTLESLPLPGAPDVVMRDPARWRLYVAIGDPGVVYSFDSFRLARLETVATEAGAAVYEEHG
jgi:hypothetical protein